MCLGNRAENAAHYVNSQLVAAWENARRCTEKHGTGFKPTVSEIEYGTCLYEFYGPGKHNRLHPSKKELAFYATFNAPRVEFVCNHEVILYISMKEGHYALETIKTQNKQIENISNFTVAFRLDFHTHSIKNIHCSKIGNDEAYSMELLIFDLASAVFSSELSNLHGAMTVTDEAGFHLKERRLKAITHYLVDYYLPLVRKAGLHVVYNLPDFDNIRSTSSHIDYSVISKTSLATRNLFGVDIDEINAYLKGLWLQAASHIDEHGAHHDNQDLVTKHYLAEHRSHWIEAGQDIHFHMVLGPLQVQALCKREVVLYLDVQQIEFHIGAAFKKQHDHRFSGWKIAFIVDISFEQVESGYIRRIHLDLNSARVCEHLCTFKGEITNKELFVRMRETLVHYVKTQYILLIQRSGHHCVFSEDVRIRGTVENGEADTLDDEEEDDEEWTCKCTDVGSCGHETAFRWGIVEKSRITHTHTHDYDQIFAVTQGAVNNHFLRIYQLAVQKIKTLAVNVRTYSSKELEIATCLAEYSLTHHEHGEEVFFNASFNAPQLQLLYNGDGSHSVVFYLGLREGFLKTLAPGKKFVVGGTEHSFANWRMAFIVDLKLRETSDEHEVPESVLKVLKRTGKGAFKQLVLDFSTATFSVDRSFIPGLLDGSDYITIRQKYEAIMHYIKEYYFKTFVRAGHDVLYTIPMFENAGHGNHKHILTSLTFQIYPYPTGSDRVFQGLGGRYRHVYDRNCIIFLGMIDKHPHPQGLLPLGCNFVGGALSSTSQGSITLSRSSFLDASILLELQKINQDTTIIPAFSGVEGSTWNLQLTTWAQNPYKKNSLCAWTEVHNSADHLDFKWENRDEWRYHHDGNSGVHGQYLVSCATHNAMRVPVGQKAGLLAIGMRGEVEVNLSYAGVGPDWKTTMTATWEGAIMLTSDATHGLHVDLSPSTINLQIAGGECKVENAQSTIKSVLEQLRTKLPVTMDFKKILGDLKTTIHNVQAHVSCSHTDLIVINPAFNSRGDLMLELAIRAQEKKSTKKQQVVHSTASSMHRENSWFRKVTDKVGEVLHVGSTSPGGNPPPNYSPPSTLSRHASKTTITSTVINNGRTVSSKTITSDLTNNGFNGLNDVE